MNPRAVMSKVIGAGLMLFFGVVWMLLGIYGGRSVPAWCGIAVLLVGLCLGTWVGLSARTALYLSRRAPPETAEEKARGKQIGRRFGLIFGLEGGAIFVTVLVLNAVQHPAAIPSAIAIIVGLHFFPLARLFRTPVYHPAGAIGCIIGIIGLLTSDDALRNSVVGLAFGTLLWVTTAVALTYVPRGRTTVRG